MWVIIGLGNPGSAYEGTRHNLGFAVTDAIAEQTGTRFKPGKGEFLTARCPGPGDMHLVKPLTYMNNSGIAAKEALDWFGADVDRMLIIVDDYHLLLGSLRLREAGGAGGHNGLLSIIWQLGTDTFPRLRLGILSAAKPVEKFRAAEFVLSPFDEDERKIVRLMIQEARAAVLALATGGWQAAMDLLSRREQN